MIVRPHSGLRDASLHVLYSPTFVNVQYCGKSKHVVSYPISRGTLVNLVAFVTIPTAEGTPLPGPAMIDNIKKEDVLNAYEGWEPEVKELLEVRNGFFHNSNS